MVDKVKLAGQVTVHKIESAYAVVEIFALTAAVAKLGTQPKVHSSIGHLPVWQVIAGLVLAGLVYKLFHLIDKQ